MGREHIYKQGFWLYGVIVGLAVKEALSNVIPHIFMLSSNDPWAFVPESLRFLVFIVLIIRFYLGSVIFFEEAYFSEDANKRYPNKNFSIDFLFGFVHFLFFFVLAVSIEIHEQPKEIFPLMLAVILLYDSLWYLACKENDTRDLIKTWAFMNIVTLMLCLSAYFMTLYIHGDPLRAEEAAFGFILLMSAIDLAEMTTQRKIFGNWLAKFTK